MQMFEETIWCLWDWYEYTDFQLQEADIDNLPELYEKDEIRFERNQWNQDRSEVSCTIFNAMWCLADLINYWFSLDEIKEYDEESYKPERWRIRWHWRLTKNAFRLVCKKYNASELSKEFWKVAFYTVNKFNEKAIEKLLAKKYTIWWNWCITAEYRADYKKDAFVEWCEFWKLTNWHAFNIINKEWQTSVKDSYAWRKTTDWKKDCNTFWLAHKLSEMTNYWQRFYTFTLVKEDNLERIKELNTIKAELLTHTESASRLRHLTKSIEYQNRLHEENERKRNERLAYINDELKKLS